MIRKIKRWFAEAEKEAETEYFDRHEIAGQKFFVFKNTLAAPVARRMAYYQALFDVELRVRGSDIDVFIKLIRNELNVGNFSRIGWLIENLAAYRNLYTSRAILFEVASPIILLPGEPMDDVKASWIEKKRALCTDSEEVASFFFGIAIDSLNRTGETLKDTNIEDYLRSKGTQQTERTFSTLIGQSIWGENLKNSTDK